MEDALAPPKTHPRCEVTRIRPPLWHRDRTLDPPLARSQEQLPPPRSPYWNRAGVAYVDVSTGVIAHRTRPLRTPHLRKHRLPRTLPPPEARCFPNYENEHKTKRRIVTEFRLGLSVDILTVSRANTSPSPHPRWLRLAEKVRTRSTLSHHYLRDTQRAAPRSPPIPPATLRPRRETIVSTPSPYETLN